MIVNLGSKENKESTWKDCFGIILCNKNVERIGFGYHTDGGKTIQDGEKRFFHDGNNLKTPVSDS